MSPSTVLAAIWLVSLRWLVAVLVPTELRRVPVRAIALFTLGMVFLRPLWGAELWLSLGTLGVAAAAIDRAFASERARALRPFLRAVLDLLFVPGLLLAWLLLVGPASAVALTAWPGFLRSPTTLRLVSFVAALALVTSGGTALVRGLLDELGKMPSALEGERPRWDLKAGKVIGNLERILILLLALRGELEAVGYVLAAKSVARFKDLDEQGFAEYYLVGTLTSALVALVVGEGLRELWSRLSIF